MKEVREATAVIRVGTYLSDGKPAQRAEVLGVFLSPSSADLFLKEESADSGWSTSATFSQKVKLYL